MPIGLLWNRFPETRAADRSDWALRASCAGIPRQLCRANLPPVRTATSALRASRGAQLDNELFLSEESGARVVRRRSRVSECGRGWLARCRTSFFTAPHSIYNEIRPRTSEITQIAIAPAARPR